MRSPWHHEPRKFLTPQQAAKLFVEHGAKCWNEVVPEATPATTDIV